MVGTLRSLGPEYWLFVKQFGYEVWQVDWNEEWVGFLLSPTKNYVSISPLFCCWLIFSLGSSLLIILGALELLPLVSHTPVASVSCVSFLNEVLLLTRFFNCEEFWWQYITVMIAWILDIAHHNILEKCFGNWVCSGPWVNWVGFSPPIWMMTERALVSETVFLKHKMMSKIHILSNPKCKPVFILNFFAPTKIENRQVFPSWYVVKQ